MAQITVLNYKNEKVDTLKLNEKLFDGKVNKALLQQAVSMYLANARLGCAATKTRGETRGGGRKPWRQKGTGRARHASIRSPIWRGGGKVFGPHPKDWHYDLPKTMKRLALLSSLNAKLLEKNLFVIDEIKLNSHKTKGVADILKNLKLNSSRVILIADAADDNLKKASKNLEGLILTRSSDLNAYGVLVNDKMLIEKKAMESLEKRLLKEV